MNDALPVQRAKSFAKLYKDNAQGIEIERLKMVIESMQAAKIEPTAQPSQYGGAELQALILDKLATKVKPTAQPAVTDAEIERIALANGFKVKEQPNGTMALNPYVYAFARALIALPVQSATEALSDTDIRHLWLTTQPTETESHSLVFARAVIAAALPVQPAKRNFCDRCGQRLGDADYIHTCTPPVVGDEGGKL